MKKTIVIFLVITMLILEGCTAASEESIQLEKNYYSFITNDELLNSGFVKKVDELDTEVSICFIDQKGLKHLYIFAVPIRYFNDETKRLELIDDRIKSCEDVSLGYAYEIVQSDFDTKFPSVLDHDKGILLSKEGMCSVEFGVLSDQALQSKYTKQRNIIGLEKNVVQYQSVFGKNSMITYPTLLGVETEIVMEQKSAETEHVFWMNIKDAVPEATQSGYILLKNPENAGEILGIIQAPILIDSSKENPNISTNCSLKLTQMDGTLYQIMVQLDNDFLKKTSTTYPVRYSLPVELRREKQPDTQVYSGAPDTNRYLSNYTLVGKDELLGIGKCYIRFVLASIFDIEPDRIQKVAYHTYSLNKASVGLNEVLEDWCSLTSTWNTPIQTGKVVTKDTEATRGKHVYDLTVQAKKWFADPERMLERFGLMMAGNLEDYPMFFLSHDNAFYNIRTEIIFQ